MKKSIFVIIFVAFFLLNVNVNVNKNKVMVNSLDYLEADLQIKEEKYFIKDNFIQPVSLKTSKELFLDGFKANSGVLSLDCNNNSIYVLMVLLFMELLQVMVLVRLLIW